MAVLIKFEKEPHFLVRSLRLQTLIERLGQPDVIERIKEGFTFSWMYSVRTGPRQYKPALAEFQLKTQDDREIIGLEIIK